MSEALITSGRIRRGLAVVMSFVVLGQPAGAQGEKPPECRLRFLAVGNAPPFKQEIRDGIRYELPPEPGSIPPRRLKLSIPGKDDEEKEIGDLRVKLGRLSEALAFKLGEGGEFVLRENEGGEPWLRLPKPSKGGDFLVVLRRDPKVGSWESAVAEFIPDQAPAGSVTLLNVCGVPVAVVFGESKLALPNGKPWRGELAAGKPVAFEYGIADAQGGLSRLTSRSLEQGAGERTLVILSRADREDARHPVKMTVLREAVR
ncbi:hypothetical protein HAHE_11460 [Haloferula helveola]|uniref:Uncharacterized protein n=1 Tax=Haloferula helveola TaxID=490095 RepID=A0ABM7R8A7_9BACT|nr:hypothetical protein HAHE_11460 [Haloferula helveola]